MPTAAIIGASRGIGLELARQYAGAGWRVHATTRTPENPGELGVLKGDVCLHHLDVRNDTHIARLADELSRVAIDVLIRNAGVLGSRGRAGPDETAETMRINAEAPIATVSALLDPVEAGAQKKIAIMSSIQGSGRPRPQSPDLYGDSKGVLNRRFREAESAWRRMGITAVAVHPGYVCTDMTGAHALLSPEESVAGIRDVLEHLGPGDAGRFLDYRSREVAW